MFELFIEWQVEVDCDFLVAKVSKGISDISKAQEVIVRADKKSFLIVEALILDGEKMIFVPELKGIEAYIEGRKEVRKILKELELSCYTELFMQAISAFIQGETYVYKERGYVTKEDYNIYWDRLEEEGCRMYSSSYSDLKKSDLRWMDYVPDNFNKNIIFERKKIYLLDIENGEIKGSLRDTYHAMDLKVFLDVNNIISKLEILFLRAPGKACFTNSQNNNVLNGKNIFSISKREVISSLGGSSGCYHIVEMMLDIFDVINGSKQ